MSRRTSDDGECNKMYYLDTNAIFFVADGSERGEKLRRDLNLERRKIEEK